MRVKKYFALLLCILYPNAHPLSISSGKSYQVNLVPFVNNSEEIGHGAAREAEAEILRITPSRIHLHVRQLDGNFGDLDVQLFRTLNAECVYGFAPSVRKKSSSEVQDVPGSSWAALTLCEDIAEGYLQVEGVGYLVDTRHHSLPDKLPDGRTKRDGISGTWGVNVVDEENGTLNGFFNLDGDTFRDLRPNVCGDTSEDMKDTQQCTRKSQFPEDTLLPQVEAAELGYLYASPRTEGQPMPGSWQTSTLKYLEMVIVIDDSVMRFHGRARVKPYVLSLLNIVNAIYQDPSLNASMHIVVKSLHFYHKRDVIQPGDAKRSLENVNAWNRQLYQSYSDDEEPHDAGLWLTRRDLGGPSGYAPVGGVCDPERSCALTRDEGLTSAFIIAHELAHILGLSHDGDEKNNNTCKDESRMGSVMAPTVSATFHHFMWSNCSRTEYALKLQQWQCLLDEPDAQRSIGLNTTLATRFSMDEQCRAEFGEGYILCRSFDIVDPCAHLWCGHVSSPLVCKTKKGPPLEGTECGLHKWCIDGFCDSNIRINLEPLKFNPQDGGWSKWSLWTACTRSCGVGMQFRTHTCDNPKPAYGGKGCFGPYEDWRICNPQSCEHPLKDFRAQQCKRMPQLLNVPNNLTWLPYESEQDDLKCKFICQTQETDEIYTSNENLVDGTLCSYEFDSKRCVQGKCIAMGCDNVVNSNKIEDGCGTCGGNNSLCTKVSKVFNKILKKPITRLGVLHNQARYITVELEIELNDYEHPHRILEDVHLILKDRKRNVFNIQKVPNEFTRKTSKKASKDKSKQRNTEILNDVRDHQDVLQNVIAQDNDDFSANSKTIIEGAMFRFHAKREFKAASNRTSQMIYVSAKGPLLNELVLFIELNNMQKLKTSLRVKMEMEYLIHRALKDSKYEWIIGGWGSCSQSCGGGKMFQTKACAEKGTQKIVPRKFCSLVTRPPTKMKSCNDFSCNFVWIPGAWESCSATCGNLGVQNREIYCVPQSIALLNKTGDRPWAFMVPPSQCGSPPVSIMQPCARISCPGHWEFTNWTECSASSENGVQTRTLHCLSNENTISAETVLNYSCGKPDYPEQQRPCCSDASSCKKLQFCMEDTSQLCTLSQLHRYCQIESFRELCCKTCAKVHIAQLSSEL